MTPILLLPNEILLHQQLGKFWNQQDRWNRPDGTVVVSNQRFLFAPTGQPQWFSIPLAQIEALQAIRVWKLIPAIRFQVKGVVFIFTFLTSTHTIMATIHHNQRPPEPTLKSQSS